jgi:hypothetical protein
MYAEPRPKANSRLSRAQAENDIAVAVEQVDGTSVDTLAIATAQPKETSNAHYCYIRIHLFISFSYT